MAKNPARKENLKEKALEELKKYAVLTLYLWVLFALFAHYRSLLLRENGINPWSQGYAILNALVFAKVLLLGGMMHLGAGLRKHTFIVVVLGRTLMFTALLMVFHVAEEAIKALIKGEHVMDGLLLIGGGSWQGVAVYAALLYIMVLPTLLVGELSYVLGSDLLWKIFTSKEEKAAA